MAHDLSNYVEVSDRLAEFYQSHPKGRIITSIVELTDKKVVVKAEVYRESDHTAPSGVGHSALGIPGATPYTRGSELENAETSAVGRALVMAGLSSKKVASADEVRAKRGSVPPASVENRDDAVLAAASVIFDAEPVFESQVGTAVAFAQVADGAVKADNAKGMSVCWKHNRPWKKKEGETNGKPWSFWSCGSRDPEAKKGWCDERPTPAWISGQEGGF